MMNPDGLGNIHEKIWPKPVLYNSLMQGPSLSPTYGVQFKWEAKLRISWVIPHPVVTIILYEKHYFEKHSFAMEYGTSVFVRGM